MGSTNDAQLFKLQPKDYKVFFRGTKKGPNGVWTLNPQKALFYADEYDGWMLLMTTSLRHEKYGNGFSFGESDLERFIQYPIMTAKKYQYKAGVVTADYQINKINDEAFMFRLAISNFPDFLCYLIDYKHIRRTNKINEYFGS